MSHSLSFLARVHTFYCLTFYDTELRKYIEHEKRCGLSVIIVVGVPLVQQVVYNNLCLWTNLDKIQTQLRF